MTFVSGDAAPWDLDALLTNRRIARISAATPLSKFALALAQVRLGLGRATWAAIGDSTTSGWGSGAAVGTAVGTGAGAGGNFLRAKAWPQQMVPTLNAAGIPSRSDAVWGNNVTSGNTAAEYVVSNPSVTLASGWIVLAPASSATIGGGLFTNSSSTTAFGFTPQVAADSFDIYYNTIPGAGTFTVTDASGTLATVNCNTASDMKKVTVTRASSSTTPISIQRNGTGAAIYIVGVAPFDSLSPRLEIWNMGYAGAKVSDWLVTTNPWSTFNAINFVKPDLYTINLGLNDANASVAAATYQANMLALAVQALTSGADVQLTLPTAAVPGSYTVPASYSTALDDISIALGLRPKIDLFNGVTLVTTDRFDAVHHAEPGYLKVAKYTLPRILAGNW